MVVPLSFSDSCCTKTVQWKGGRFWLETKLSIFSELLVAFYPAGNQNPGQPTGYFPLLNAIQKELEVMPRYFPRTTSALGGRGVYLRVHYRD